LLWIHPFIDGNGRVARLYTDAFVRKVGLGGHGLWTASRGLARHRKQYLDALAAADAERWDDYDGRGVRSSRALIAFCQFFLEVCLDQVRYMGGLLAIDGLSKRIETYATRRAMGGLGSTISSNSGHLIVEAMLRGTLPRGSAARVLGVSERSARRVLGTLLKERLLLSDSAKGPVRIGLPTIVVPHYFPQLYPEGVVEDAPITSSSSSDAGRTPHR
jgi:Fic family protein